MFDLGTILEVIGGGGGVCGGGGGGGGVVVCVCVCVCVCGGGGGAGSTSTGIPQLVYPVYGIEQIKISFIDYSKIKK